MARKGLIVCAQRDGSCGDSPARKLSLFAGRDREKRNGPSLALRAN